MILFNGNERNEVLSGRTVLGLRSWHHLVLVREEVKATVYLDGVVEMEGDLEGTLPEGVKSLFLGGRCDGFANFEGKLDEVALYSRALGAGEIRAHYWESLRVSGKH